MTVAQGIERYFVFAEQSGLGVPATSGGQKTRRRTAAFVKTADTYNNDEIVSHQQSTGDTAGQRRTTGNLDGLLSPGTYTKQFGNLLRKDFAATAAITAASITIAASGQAWTLTRAAGSFLADGIKGGDVVRLTAGTFNAANLNKNLLVLSMTATALTVKPLNNTPLVPEGPITGATVTVPGKKAWAPTSGHTNKYFTVEDCQPGIGTYHQFIDVKISQAALNLPATGNAGVVFDCPGLKRTKATGSPTIAAPADETTSAVLTAVNGMIVVGGAVVPITGATITISGNINPAEAEVGSDAPSDHQRGRITVSGQFTGKYTGDTLVDMFDSQVPTSIYLVMTDSQAANAEFISFVVPRLKLFGDAPDDGEKEIIRSYTFTAEINGAGGPALASHATILSTQDSLAA